MATSREVRYVSPNDIGKIVTYINPAHAGVLHEGQDLKLGGRLLDLETEAEWYVNRPIMGPETRELGRVKVKLNIDGQWVEFESTDSVTLHGMGE